MTATEHLDRPFPMLRVHHRVLPDSFSGPVFVSDIDKTYLDTRFSQLKGLLKIPFEFGIDKRSYPGMAALLRALREGPGGHEHRPLFFISASPPQLRKAIENKMLIDGVEFDGITFKDPLRLLRKRQFDQLKEQVAFKISALLLLLRTLPVGAQLVLFGDDAEKDALIYCLFGDLAAGRLSGSRLHHTLVQNGVREQYANEITELSAKTRSRDAVARIYIHLVRDPSGQSIAPFTASVVGFANASAAASDLLSQGWLAEGQLAPIHADVTQLAPTHGGAADDDAGWLTPAHYLAT